MKTIIVHFQPLELYPPIMNLLNYLNEKKSSLEIRVISTTNRRAISLNTFGSDLFGIVIRRIKVGTISDNNLSRLFKYLIFNIFTLTQLIFYKPSSILYYETISSWAPLFYKKFFNKECKVIAHYHEYTSVKEYRTGSFFVKFLWQLEKKRFHLLNIVSHTNRKRMSLFQDDYPLVCFQKKLIMPNYPPVAWSKYKSLKKGKIKLVYVGAISLETMFLKSISEWIQKQEGNLSLDIYTINIKANAKIYIENLMGKGITLKGGVSYQNLPIILPKYDIGLILYKGHIPNYVYNAPNKLFEYLACGLDVWLPVELLGAHEYVNEQENPLVMKVDFNSNESINLSFKKYRALKGQIHTKQRTTYFCEPVYANMLNELVK